MGARVRQAFLSGSYSSTVLSTRCATVGWMAGLVAPGAVVAPPITYILPPTVAATAAPRLVGMGEAVMRVTLKSISDRLAELGHKADFEKGDGYFYFSGGEANDWLDRTVKVPNSET